MTTTQLHVFNLMYLLITAAVAYFTRATPRRIAGALAGAFVAGVVGLGIIAVCERAGWWHMVISWTPYFLALLLIDMTVCGFLFLLTWRIARRWGWRGLAVTLIVAAIVGPPRDYMYMRYFPEWGHYGPGIAPYIAISGAYVILIAVGHGVMRLVAGPSSANSLARQTRQAA